MNHLNIAKKTIDICKQPASRFKMAAERFIDDDFREEWPSTADTLDRQRYVRYQPFHRIHTGFSASDTLVYGGPVFDSNKMVDRLLETMEGLGVTGYSYALARFGQLVDAGGVGNARTPSEDNPLAMSHNTKMVSASLAKPICAVSVMKLVENGALSLDETAYPHIAPIFPDVHSDIEGIKIRQLLRHTAGLNGGGKLSNFESVLKNTATPTTNSAYHNANYWFLAFVVEGVTGGGYIDFAKEQILAPMTITGMNNEDDAIPCLYYPQGGTDDGSTWGDSDSTAIGAYGWYASAIHWAKFLAYFRYDKVLSSATRQQMLNDPAKYFGFRRWLNERRGTYYGHGGDFKRGSDGFRGGIMGFPDYVDAVLLVNNRGGFDPESILIDAYHAAYE